MFKCREYLRREREVELARQGLEPRAILFAKAARGIAPSDEHAAVLGRSTREDGFGGGRKEAPNVGARAINFPTTGVIFFFRTRRRARGARALREQIRRRYRWGVGCAGEE